MPVNLYLMPALIMIGYLVRYEHPADVISFLSQLRFVFSTTLSTGFSTIDSHDSRAIVEIQRGSGNKQADYR